MKGIIKRWLIDSPLEGLARRAYDAIQGGGGAGAADLSTDSDAQTMAVMERVLERRSNCIDVGCHKGLILDVMLRLAPQGRHFAFEPLPDLFAGLQRKYAAAANLSLHEVALSDSVSEATFQHVVSNPGYSGLLRRRYDRPNEDVAEITVRLARLDDIVSAATPIRFVKIDVEGAELQVLRGATAMLRRDRPFVVFEHGQGAADCYGTRPEHVFDLFAECGLHLSLMNDWLAPGGKQTLSRDAFIDQFDASRNYYFLAHP